MARKHPAYIYTFAAHARRAVLDADFAARAREALGRHPAYAALGPRPCKAFWTELGRALPDHDAAIVGATCEILAEALLARRITCKQAAGLARNWRLGRLDRIPERVR